MLPMGIVTPSFQQGRFLERTLQSVLRQSVPPWRYWVVDGGSTDETVPLLQQYGDRLSWVSEMDNGQAHAVNKGIEYLITEGLPPEGIVGWLNSDDVYRPETLARVQREFTCHPEVDLLYGLADYIDDQNKRLRPYAVEPWNPERLRRRCFLCQPAVFFRRRLFDRLGPLDESLRFCLDYDYWVRAARAGVAVHYLPVALADSRLYAATKSLGQREQAHAEANDLVLRHYGQVEIGLLFDYCCARLQLTRGRGLEQMLSLARLLPLYGEACRRWNRGLTVGKLAALPVLLARKLMGSQV